MGYTDAFGLMPLRQKISDYYMQKYEGVPEERIGTERIVVTTGSSGGFLLAFTACFDAGDTIAIASSGYPCYRNILMALGCELANCPISAEFKLTATELRNEIQQRKEAGKKKLKGLILSSPSNPTGAMLSADELKELCELCEEENIRFLSDEIYHGEYQRRFPLAFGYFATFTSLMKLSSKWFIVERNLLWKEGGHCTVILFNCYRNQFLLQILFHVWVETWLDDLTFRSSGANQRLAAEYVHQCKRTSA